VISLLLALQAAAPPPRPPDTTFAGTVAALSEPGGFFFSDNLVSNETSYLHVVPRLKQVGGRGGAYIGVGPEQNFSYIARLRPSVAFIVDIRRDNLLLHLFLKAVFERADTRLEYLCLLYARRCPADPARWKSRSIDEIVAYIDRQPRDSGYRAETEAELFAVVWTFGVPISGTEFETLRRLHDEFVSNGLDLQFTAYGRRAVATFPTVRQLYLERDLAGRRQSFLADESAYTFVRQLERTDRVIPVVGDLGGDHAIKAIGRWLRERNEQLSLFYLSNVEFYLMRQGSFDRFVANLKSLPLSPRSLLTRSYFTVQTGMPHPNQQPNHLSVQLLQRVERFFAAAAQPELLSYWRLMTEGLEPLNR
jgi:hypothetical protein